MGNKKAVIHLHTPRIEGNKIFFSWEKNPLFEESTYWVEYKDLKKLDCSQEALLEAYLPICLALSFLGDVTVKLPGYVSPIVLETWNKVCRDTTRVLSKKNTDIEFIVPQTPKECISEKEDFKETALLFGGGSESLLTLAHLLDQGILPYLASVWGDSWPGSSPDCNHEKFELEEEICREFKLRIIRIHTNIRTIFIKKNFKPYLRRTVYIINAALFLPINISVLLPIARHFKIGNIISGNEKEGNYGIDYYSLSSAMTKNLYLPGKYVKYRSDLENLTKIEVLKELHKKYPHIAKYQYSCFSAVHARWCLNCEKCLRNYIVYKILDINPANVGMDESIMLRQLQNIIFETKKQCNKNKAYFIEWMGIKQEAVNQNKKEIVKLIDTFCSQDFISSLFSRRI